MITTEPGRRGSTVVGFLGWVVSWSFVPIAVVAAAYFRDGRSLAEKTATDLVMPLTAICWISLVFGLKSLVRGDKAAAFVGVFLSAIIFIGGNAMVSQTLLRNLEEAYPEIEIDKVEPFDTLIVLGGGTSKSPNDRAQFADSGDRVGLAARLYLSKRAEKLIVTGDVLRGTENSEARDPSVQSKRLLVELGVASADIIELEGTNTSEEIAALKKRTDLWEGKRCGLVTSGFHMPRAMRLAKHQDVAIIPVVADYRSGNAQAAIRDWLPSTGAMRGTETVIREFLAQLVGR